MPTRQFAKVLVAAVLVLCLTGCASSRLTHEPGLVKTWDHVHHASGVPPMAVVLHMRQLRFDVPVNAYFGPHWNRSSTQKQLERVEHEFAFIQPHPGMPTPYRLVIEATHATGGNQKWSRVSGLTNFIVPCVEESRVELDARLLRDGVVVNTYEAVGSYKTKKHLLLLLWPPAWRRTVPAMTTADTFRDLFLQIERDAASFAPAAATTEPAR